MVQKGTGDYAYRFRLHSASVLAAAGLSTESDFDGLRKIYDERSKAAHGSSIKFKDRRQLATLAIDARKIAARLILAIAQLVESGDIKKSSGEDLNSAVERFICEKLTATSTWQK